MGLIKGFFALFQANRRNYEFKKPPEQGKNKNIDSCDFEKKQKKLSMSLLRRTSTTIPEIIDLKMMEILTFKQNVVIDTF